jgi:uncharacterized protein
MARKLRPIPRELILNRMRFENPWWETGAIEPQYDDLGRRLYFELFIKLVQEFDIRRAVVLMGPRRVGKTVLMHHAIAQLLPGEAGRQRSVCFLNIENPLYLNMGLEELFRMAMYAAGNEDPRGWYVFFDEIQYLKDWEIHLKVLVDSFPDTKFIVSGSSAAALKLKSTESGAGRFTNFMLPPLTFHEYIHLKGFDNIIIPSQIQWQKKHIDFFSTSNIELLNRHFIDYINYGGYPEVIFSAKIRSNLGRYIKSDIIDKVLLRDLPGIYGIQNVQELNNFFTTLVYYTGNELSIESLSVASSVNKLTLRKYLEYLEAAFLIKQINRVDEGGKKFKRQNFYKVYLTNPSLRSAVFSPLEATDDGFGLMVETAIFSQWLHRNSPMPCYARWGNGEVDMVGLGNENLKPQWAVEIKWSNKAFFHISTLKNLLHFCEKNRLQDAFATTLDKWGQQDVSGVSVNFVPAAVYAYNVGYNTIARQFQQMMY